MRPVGGASRRALGSGRLSTRWRSGTGSLEGAEIIGDVREEPAWVALIHTRLGGSRMIDMLVVEDPLPRIC